MNCELGADYLIHWMYKMKWLEINQPAYILVNAYWSWLTALFINAALWPFYMYRLTETGFHFQGFLPFGLGFAPHPLWVHFQGLLPFGLGSALHPFRVYSGATFKVCSLLAWGLLLTLSGFTLGPLCVDFQGLLPFGLGSAPYPLRVYSGVTLGPLSRFAPLWLGSTPHPLRVYSGATLCRLSRFAPLWLGVCSSSTQGHSVSTQAEWPEGDPDSARNGN